MVALPKLLPDDFCSPPFLLGDSVKDSAESGDFPFENRFAYGQWFAGSSGHMAQVVAQV